MALKKSHPIIFTIVLNILSVIFTIGIIIAAGLRQNFWIYFSLALIPYMIHVAFILIIYSNSVKRHGVALFFDLITLIGSLILISYGAHNLKISSEYSYIIDHTIHNASIDQVSEYDIPARFEFQKSIYLVDSNTWTNEGNVIAFIFDFNCPTECNITILGFAILLNTIDANKHVGISSNIDIKSEIEHLNLLDNNLKFPFENITIQWGDVNANDYLSLAIILICFGGFCFILNCVFNTYISMNI